MRNSKESLRILLDNACNEKEGFIPLMNECYIKIEKDLEILEILKDKLDIAVYEDKENNTYIMMLRFPKYYHNELIKISKGEYELLKERLVNDN